MRHQLSRLALIAALDAGATQIAIIATWGGRADHALGTASLLTHPRLAAAGATAELLDAASRIRALQGDGQLRLEVGVGAIVSLIPWGGDALVSATGEVQFYVTPAPGVNLRPFLGREIGVTGIMGYLPEQRMRHVTAKRVEELDGIIAAEGIG